MRAYMGLVCSSTHKQTCDSLRLASYLKTAKMVYKVDIRTFMIFLGSLPLISQPRAFNESFSEGVMVDI